MNWRAHNFFLKYTLEGGKKPFKVTHFLLTKNYSRVFSKEKNSMRYICMIVKSLFDMTPVSENNRLKFCPVGNFKARIRFALMKISLSQSEIHLGSASITFISVSVAAEILGHSRPQFYFSPST